jgi:hypothetical protein
VLRQKGQGKDLIRFTITNEKKNEEEAVMRYREETIYIYICSLRNRINAWMPIGRMSFVALWNYTTTQHANSCLVTYYYYIRIQGMECHCSWNNMLELNRRVEKINVFVIEQFNRLDDKDDYNRSSYQWNDE